MNDRLSDFKQSNRWANALAKHYFGYNKKDLVIRKIRLLIRQNFGPNSYYIGDLKEIENSFPESTPELYEPSYDSSEESRQWYVASQKLVNLLDTMSNDLESKTGLAPHKETNDNSKLVFIVHGTDHKPVQELKEVLNVFGLKPLVLEDLPSASNTIIEKLEKYSNVQFAFIVLTPDDSGIGKYDFLNLLQKFFNKQDASQAEIKEMLDKTDFNQKCSISELHTALHKDRARQNVILEFGYFIGRLGRRQVCCLYQGDLELPSDMQGICYLHFNDTINEIKDKIVKELRDAKIISLGT
jgi:predicted nucleotide-binding protein